MTAFIIRRVMQSAVVVFIMAVIVFFGVNVIGDPIDMLINPEADQAEIEKAIRALGLDRPIGEQFLFFLKNALQGDLGRSFIFGEPALQLIIHHMPATMELAIVSLLLTVVIAIPLGLYAGLYPEASLSRAIMGSSILGFSLPSFWVGIMMIMVFAVMLGWLPSTGRGETATFLGITSSVWTLDGLSHIVLPAVNLSLLKMALAIRLVRAGVREAMQQDYIKFARAKGLAWSRIIRLHLLKNIMIPVTTVLGLELGNTIAFSVVTETIFAWPGMGKLLIDSILQLDRPVIVAYLIIIVLVFIIINLVVDIIYTLLDPRVRLEDRD
ncbi:MAG: ABC transporter permease [Hyphomicrobiaceae bacterium]